MNNIKCVSSMVLISLAVSCSVVYINNWFLYSHACPGTKSNLNSNCVQIKK